MGYYIHIVDEGDRWDTLAYIYWGDAGLVPELIADNPHLPIMEELRVGMEVYVNENLPQKTNENTDPLPPWKQ